MNWQLALVCLAALCAGAVNSVAGGGTLLTFPVLIAVLTHKLGDEKTAAVVANQTSTTALIPGIFAAAWGYRASSNTRSTGSNISCPPASSVA